MAKDYIPDPDADFRLWEANFIAYLSMNVAALGLLPADITPVVNAQGVFEDALVAHEIAQAEAQSARAAKDQARAEFEELIRTLVRQLQASAAVSDAEREGLGITVRDATPTPAGEPTTRPVLQADTRQPNRLTIAFADEGTPTKKAKPAGVTACLLQFKKGGTAPAADADWEFLAIDSGTPYVAEFDSADAGAAVWVRGCWINSRQQRGPWSNTLSTRVPG